MSMLLRYRKPGGFQQLLQLIESSAPIKREQLLGLIKKEDATWATLLRQKLLSVERVMSWQPLHIAEVVAHIPARHVATLLHTLPQGSFDRMTYTLSHQQKLEIKDLFDRHDPTSGEVEAARIKFLAVIRQLERDGKLKLKDIDPTVTGHDDKSAS